MKRTALFATAVAVGLALPTFALAASACDGPLASAADSYDAFPVDAPMKVRDHINDLYNQAMELAESDPTGCLKLVGQMQAAMSKQTAATTAMKAAPATPQAAAAATGPASGSKSASAPAGSANTKAATDYIAALAKSDAAVDTLSTVGKTSPESKEMFNTASQEAGKSAAELRATFERIDVPTLVKGMTEQLQTQLSDAQAGFVSATVAREVAFGALTQTLDATTRDTPAVQQAWKEAQAADAALTRATAVLDLAQVRAEAFVDVDNYDDMYPGYAEAFRQMKIRHMRAIRLIDLKCDDIFKDATGKMLKAFVSGRKQNHAAAGEAADKECLALHKPVAERQLDEAERLRLKYTRMESDDDLAPMDDLYGNEPDKKPKPKPKPEPKLRENIDPIDPDLLAPLTPSKKPPKPKAKAPSAPPKKP